MLQFDRHMWLDLVYEDVMWWGMIKKVKLQVRSYRVTYRDATPLEILGYIYKELKMYNKRKYS